MIYIPLISSNIITMKFKGTGNENIFINNKNGIDCPNRIYIDEKLISKKTCKYKFLNKIVSIQIEWDKNFIHCYKMFADISNIIEIDLSQFNSSLVKSMSYMFDNCKSLKFVNLSNIDISSLINMDNAFRNCKSLKSIDLTNIGILKILNHKNIFYNYNDLKNKNIKIRLLTTNIYCEISQIFDDNRDCPINLDSANEDIIDELKNESYRISLINKFTQGKKNISTNEQNETFTISKLEFEETIKIKDCETVIKNHYNINNNENLYIYKHEINKTNQIMPEINFEIFNLNGLYDIEICSGISFQYIYYLSNEHEVIDGQNYVYCGYNKIDKIIKYNGHNYTGNKYNDNDQSFYICDKKCLSNSYEYPPGILICKCPIIASNGNENSIINDECLIKLENQNISDNNEAYDLIQSSIIQLFSQEQGIDQFFEGFEKIIYQLTTTENQKRLINNKSANNNKVSIIDLADCEDKLKEENHINESDSLIILKYENVSNNIKASEKNIQFDVFNPYTKEKLDLSICENININIFVKAILSDDTKKMYDQAKQQGYDIFNINDKFYQDICTPYKSSVNTDLTLSGRKDYIFNNDDTLCQPNCELSGYSMESEYASCECNVNVNKVKSVKKVVKFKPKKIYESFIDVLKYSNYEVFKCYKLVMNKNIFFSNLGNIIILFYFFIYFICYIIYLIKGETPLKHKLFELFDDNNIDNKNNILIINPTQNINKISLPPKKNKLNNTNNINIISNSIYIGKRNSDKQKINLKGNNSKLNVHYNSNNSSIYSKEKFSIVSYYGNSEVLPIRNKSKVKNKELSDFELSELEYEEAVKLDKRNFFTIYFAILKREHIILFTFCSCNDFNLLYIKIARFIVLFATDMAMNVFFFNDETMNKIFLSYGKYNIVQQIPKIVYSTILSLILEVFLCYLSMTDKYIYKIKNSEFNSKQVLNIFRCMNLKLIIFFIFTFILFIFYWYIVTSFCEVYQNTQIIFIKDSLFSFLLGIIYPLFIYLIPSGFRLCSIQKMNHKCLYKLSNIIPFF